MRRFIEGEDRTQVTLLPACLDDYVEAENPVRVVEVFVDGLDLGALGFVGVDPAATGRPAYHPAVLLKLYIYGYLNRLQSSRRLEREAQRNVELMWLTGRLMPDFKTIANFRKDNGRAIRKVCRQFIVLCRQLNLFTAAIVAIDGSKFKAVNNRDKNFTPAKMQRRMAQIEESIARYLTDMDTADRAEPEVAELKKGRLQEKIAALKEQMQRLRRLEAQMLASPEQHGFQGVGLLAVATLECLADVNDFWINAVRHGRNEGIVPGVKLIAADQLPRPERHIRVDAGDAFAVDIEGRAVDGREHRRDLALGFQVGGGRDAERTRERCRKVR